MQVYLSAYFLRQIKPALKKYHDLEDDIIGALENFIPETATSLGHKLYKIRLRTPAISKGKNKSFRMVIFLFELGDIITPIVLYFKGDQENIDKRELITHLKNIVREIEGKK